MLYRSNLLQGEKWRSKSWKNYPIHNITRPDIFLLNNIYYHIITLKITTFVFIGTAFIIKQSKIYPKKLQYYWIWIQKIHFTLLSFVFLFIERLLSKSFGINQLWESNNQAFFGKEKKIIFSKLKVVLLLLRLIFSPKIAWYFVAKHVDIKREREYEERNVGLWLVNKKRGRDFILTLFVCW